MRWRLSGAVPCIAKKASFGALHGHAQLQGGSLGVITR